MKRPILPSILLIAAASAALAFTAGRAAPPPPVIAFVDMSKVIEALDENAALSKELTDFGKQLEQELEKERKALEDERESAKLMPDGQERRAKNEDLARRTIVLGANKDVSERLFGMRRINAIQTLYEKVDAAAGKLAKDRGYTIVLANDENLPIPRDDVEGFQRATALKRVLYVDPRHDMTEDLITVMNNEWAAAGGKPAPKPAAAPVKPAAEAKKN